MILTNGRYLSFMSVEYIKPQQSLSTVSHLQNMYSCIYASIAFKLLLQKSGLSILFLLSREFTNKNLRKQTNVMIRNLVSLFIFSCIGTVYALLRHKKGFYGLMSIAEVLQNSFKYQKHLPFQLDNLL